MPRGDNLKEFKPPAGSVWRCSCGFTGSYYQTCAHRRGYRKRPECFAGFEMIDGGPEVEQTDQSDRTDRTDQTVVEPAEVRDEGPPQAHHVEEQAFDMPQAPNSEELAARYNQLRLEELASGLLPPEADWTVEQTQGPPQVSEARETVMLPVVVRLIYDWARSQRWKQGNGTLSDFVTDVVVDHFEHCWGKKIVVVDREEVELAGRRIE